MIDGKVFYGKNPANGQEANLTNWLDSSGCSTAIVSSYKSIFHDYVQGNEELLNFCGDNLIPAITFNSYRLEDFGYLDSLYDRGARVLSLHLAPCYYEVNLSSNLIQDALRYAAKLGFTVQVSLNSIDDLYKVQNLHLTSPVLICWTYGRGYYYAAEILHCCRKFENFFFEIGTVTSQGSIKHLVEEAGADRFFFGSGVPECFPYSTHMMIQCSGVSDKDLEFIYSRTLCNALGIPKTGKLNQLKESCESNWSGILNQQKIDTHFHLSGFNIIETRLEPEHIIEDLKRCNTKRAILSSSEALNGRIEEGNSTLCKVLDNDSSNTLFGYIVINPLEVEASVAEVGKYKNNPKFLGIKTIQDLYGLTLDAEGYREILKAISDDYLPFLAHIPGMLEIAKDFPNQKFIAAHSTWERIKHLRAQSNVVFDLTTSHNDPVETKLKHFVEQVGLERMLYGSDGQLISPYWTLGKLVESGLDNKQLKAILHDNALKLFPSLNSF